MTIESDTWREEHPSLAAILDTLYGGGSGTTPIILGAHRANNGAHPLGWTDIFPGGFTLDLSGAANWQIFAALSLQCQNTDAGAAHTLSVATFLNGDPGNDEYEDEADIYVGIGDTLHSAAIVQMAPLFFTNPPLTGAAVFFNPMYKVDDNTLVVNDCRAIIVAIPQ